jgi:hypothetical protein
MHSEWNTRFFASVLLVLLFPVLIFLALPNQPSILDIILIVIGIASGFPLSIYMIRNAQKETKHSKNTKSSERVSIFISIVIVILISLSSIWISKRFMLTLIASIFVSFLIAMIFLMVHYWRNRPRT